MCLRAFILSGLVLLTFTFSEASLRKTENTCAMCHVTQRRQSMERFKACKLVAVRHRLYECLNITTELKRQIVNDYIGVSENDLNRPLHTAEYLSVEDLINQTYIDLQEAYLSESFVQFFNQAHYLNFDTTALRQKYKQLLCQLGAVLQYGSFNRNTGVTRCIVSAEVQWLDRTSGINFIINFLRDTAFNIEKSVRNINYLLLSS